MTAVRRGASLAMHQFFRLLKLMRLGPVGSMSSSDVAGNAHAFTYAILATFWQRRTGAPRWESIYQKWLSRLPDPGSVDERLYGTFDNADRFELLTDNKVALERRLELCRTARRAVDVSTYYIQGDETGWRMARELAACAARGVRVRIVADSNATEQKAVANPHTRKLLYYLRRSRAEFRLFAKIRRPYDACHRKLQIVDGHYLITGGRNYANHYAGTEWRDIDLLLEGPTVRDVQQHYESTFEGQPKHFESDGMRTVFHATTPEEIETNAAFLYLVQCIRASRVSVDIENAYYFNHPIIYRALAEATKRGVRVRLLTNSIESNDLPTTSYRIYAGFPALLDAGVELYLRKGRQRTLHCKYFVIDREWVGLGSSNLDHYSPRFCLELGVQVKDARLGGMLTDWFAQGLCDSNRIRDRHTVKAAMQRLKLGRFCDRFIPDIQ